MTNEILIILAIYILSALRMYYWYRNAFSKGGIWERNRPGVGEVLFTLLPIVNTIIAIYATSSSLTGKKYPDSDYNWVARFFKLKH